MSTVPSKKAERFHLARAFIWPLALPLILFMGWENSVFVLLVISLYANFTGDLGAYHAARGDRHSKEES